MKNKIIALAKHLDAVNDIDRMSVAKYDKNIIEFGDREYFVLTDKQADKKAAEEILNSLWAFDTTFIINNSIHKDLESGARHAAIEGLKKIQETLCESADAYIRTLIKSKKNFVKKALEADGRSHFLARYDGKEYSQDYKGTTYYIFRVN